MKNLYKLFKLATPPLGNEVLNKSMGYLDSAVMSLFVDTKVCIPEDVEITFI